MNARQWTALVCTLTASGLVYAYPTMTTPASQRQQSTVSLATEALGQPVWLAVTAPGGRLTGNVSLNGRRLATLSNTSNLRLDLAPRLSPGRHSLVLQGGVSPPQTTVSLELQGTGLQVAQQTSGNSKLDREIILNVR